MLGIVGQGVNGVHAQAQPGFVQRPGLLAEAVVVLAGAAGQGMAHRPPAQVIGEGAPPQTGGEGRPGGVGPDDLQSRRVDVQGQAAGAQMDRPAYPLVAEARQRER